MKKVKMMLTAVTVFAIVGGALAFKAQKFGSTVYTTSDESGTPTCPLEKAGFTTTTINPGTPKISVSTIQSGTCVLSWVKEKA